MVSQNYIKILEQCYNAEIGTKAKNLKIIREKTKFLVPKTLILTAGLHKKLFDFNKIKNPFTFNWEHFKISTKYENEIIEKIKNIFHDKPLVIRSSATCEDSPILSFAGQYSTFLNIKGRKNIIKAICLCYRSLFSANAKIYAKFNNIKLENEKMAIAIQEVVPVKVSGIIFTVDPVSGDKEKIIIEYTQGFGDKIVSGHKMPNYIELPKISFRKTNLIFFRELLKIAKELEKVFNYPQDIEWGFNGKKFYIFQSRPVTTLQNKPVKIKQIKEKLTLVGNGKIACLGQAQGKLRLIKSLNDLKKIQKGDIVFNKGKININIVTKILEIAGFITTGGVLSHIAVIAREFNKPCLVEPLKFNAEKYKNKNIFLNALKGEMLV